MPTDREIQQELEIERLTKERDGFRTKVGEMEKSIGSIRTDGHRRAAQYDLAAAMLAKRVSHKAALDAAFVALSEGEPGFDKDGRLSRPGRPRRRGRAQPRPGRGSVPLGELVLLPARRSASARRRRVHLQRERRSAEGQRAERRPYGLDERPGVDRRRREEALQVGRQSGTVWTSSSRSGLERDLEPHTWADFRAGAATGQLSRAVARGAMARVPGAIVAAKSVGVQAGCALPVRRHISQQTLRWL